MSIPMPHLMHSDRRLSKSDSSFHHFLTNDTNAKSAMGLPSTKALPHRIPEATSSLTYDDSSTSSSFLGTRGDEKMTDQHASSKPSPVHNATSMLASVKKKLMTQSTIYKRHEARLARSYALRDDPRPAFLRVLSGLPVIRIIIPPYQSDSENVFDVRNKQQRGRQTSTTKVSPGAYTEETLFDRYSTSADDNVSPASTEINDGAYDLTRERVLQATLATGFCAGVSEYVFAYCNNNKTARLKSATMASSSPFHNLNATGLMTGKANTIFQHSSLLFRHNSSVASAIAGSEITREMPSAFNNNNNSPMSTTNKARPSSGAFSKAVSTAFPISLLFSTKVLSDATLDNQQKDTELNRKSSRPAIDSIFSSAVAGGVVGLSRIAHAHFESRQQPKQPTLSIIHQQCLNSRYALNTIGRNVVAAILYFSIYDGVSSISSTSKSSLTDPDTTALPSISTTVRTNERKGTLNIVAGGAMAGMAQVAVLNFHRYGHYGSTIWWTRIMLPAASRAAPIHAFVFYGYEKMKEGMKIES